MALTVQPKTTIIRRNARAHCAPGGQIVITSSTTAVVVLHCEIDELIEELKRARTEALAHPPQVVRARMEQPT
jgi:hypothetical protein